jgi:hypothetical protein
MGSSRVDEQMAIVAAMLKAIADDVRQLRRAVETGMAAHARHVAREAMPVYHIEFAKGVPVEEMLKHDPMCDYLDSNPDGIRKPCNCGSARGDRTHGG